MINKTKHTRSVQQRTRKTSIEEKKLLLSAHTGSALAVRESRALGLTIKIISKGKIIEKYPDGKIKIVKKINDVPLAVKGLKRGTVLCRK